MKEYKNTHLQALDAVGERCHTHSKIFKDTCFSWNSKLLLDCEASSEKITGELSGNARSWNTRDAWLERSNQNKKGQECVDKLPAKEIHTAEMKGAKNKVFPPEIIGSISDKNRQVEKSTDVDSISRLCIRSQLQTAAKVLAEVVGQLFSADIRPPAIPAAIAKMTGAKKDIFLLETIGSISDENRQAEKSYEALKENITDVDSKTRLCLRSRSQTAARVLAESVWQLSLANILLPAIPAAISQKTGAKKDILSSGMIGCISDENRQVKMNYEAKNERITWLCHRTRSQTAARVLVEGVWQLSLADIWLPAIPAAISQKTGAKKDILPTEMIGSISEKTRQVEMSYGAKNEGITWLLHRTRSQTAARVLAESVWQLSLADIWLPAIPAAISQMTGAKKDILPTEMIGSISEKNRQVEMSYGAKNERITWLRHRTRSQTAARVLAESVWKLFLADIWPPAIPAAIAQMTGAKKDIFPLETIGSISDENRQAEKSYGALKENITDVDSKPGYASEVSRRRQQEFRQSCLATLFGRHLAASDSSSDFAKTGAKKDILPLEMIGSISDENRQVEMSYGALNERIT